MILKNGNMSKYFFFLLTVLLDSSFLEAAILSVGDPDENFQRYSGRLLLFSELSY